MRSQYKFVITAGLVCHLFVGASLVTSQARPDASVKDTGPVEETQSAAPAQTEQPAQTPSQEQVGPCRVTITSPAGMHQGTQPGSGQKSRGVKAGAPGSGKNLQISQEHPVTIQARQCEKAGDVYTL